MTDKKWERILEKSARRTNAVRKRMAVTELIQPNNEELYELQEKYGHIRIK
jgi:hypothetical protein